jgi:uncharacterized membrane protein (DUF373 family)
MQLEMYEDGYWVNSLSPTTKFLVLALFIAVVITLLWYLLDIPFSWNYSRAMLGSLVIAFVLYALLTKIADRLRHKKISP